MIKKLTAALIAITLLITTNSIGTLAEPVNKSKDEDLRQSVFDVVCLLKEVFDSKYQEVEEEVKQLIIDNGYDYALTMETFYDQPNPIKDADLIRYLSSYMSCKKYARENSVSIPQIIEIPFIKYEKEEFTSEEYIPTLIDDYIQDQNVLDEYILVKGNKYITSEVTLPIYELQDNGHYKKTDKTQTISPNTKDITYIKVDLSYITPEELFSYLGIDENLVSDDYERRVALIKEVITNDAIASTISIRLPQINFNGLDLTEYQPILDSINDIRKTIVTTALSLQDKVPYEWGGKANSPGYDSRWWTYNSDNGLQHGLDCSGYVQWVLMTSGLDKSIYSQCSNTRSILQSSLKQVSSEELKPGDIGVTNRPNGQINHCGIYVGNGKWAHCSSTKKTVVVSKVDFTTFYSPTDGVTSINKDIVLAYANSFINSNSITNNIDMEHNSLYYTYNYNTSDVMLLAKLIYSEARGEGINGWIGVGEVVMNRVNSDLFPQTVSEVIYQTNQFSDSDKIADYTPTEDMVTVAQMVLSGNLKVIDNPNVLYFRNPMKTSNVPSTTPQDWGTHRWYLAINHHAFYLQ